MHIRRVTTIGNGFARHLYPTPYHPLTMRLGPPISSSPASRVLGYSLAAAAWGVWVLAVVATRWLAHAFWHAVSTHNTSAARLRWGRWHSSRAIPPGKAGLSTSTLSDFKQKVLIVTKFITGRGTVVIKGYEQKNSINFHVPMEHVYDFISSQIFQITILHQYW